MRITNGMVAENALQNINKAANRMAAASAAVSSNKKIQLASDDPVVATRGGNVPKLCLPDNTIPRKCESRRCLADGYRYCFNKFGKSLHNAAGTNDPRRLTVAL